jgi:hypothetical protein
MDAFSFLVLHGREIRRPFKQHHFSLHIPAKPAFPVTSAQQHPTNSGRPSFPQSMSTLVWVDLQESDCEGALLDSLPSKHRSMTRNSCSQHEVNSPASTGTLISITKERDSLHKYDAVCKAVRQMIDHRNVPKCAPPQTARTANRHRRSGPQHGKVAPFQQHHL